MIKSSSIILIGLISVILIGVLLGLFFLTRKRNPSNMFQQFPQNTTNNQTLGTQSPNYQSSNYKR